MTQRNRILVTGANGNVGAEVVRALVTRGIPVRAAVRNPESAAPPQSVEVAHFDFADLASVDKALEGVDGLFLLRPPKIAAVKRYLFPVIDRALSAGVQHVVFLSLQGVERNRFTPHFKVEEYLREIGAPATMLRPNFFMQNLNTFYREEIADQSEIYLPAGHGRTAFVDVRDIGDAAGEVFSDEAHIGQAYTLTGPEALDYWQVAELISAAVGRPIHYANPSPRQYACRLEARGLARSFIAVQQVLYYVVRHNLSAEVTPDLEQLLGHFPRTLSDYARDCRGCWTVPTNQPEG